MKHFFILPILLALLLPGCGDAQENGEATEKQPVYAGTVALAPPTGGEEVQVRVEVVDTNESRTKGLMFRKTLPEDTGMLFIFPYKTELKFWMKNTLVPLDMIFIDEGVVVGIVENARPLDLTPRGVNTPSSQVLEVPGGFSEKHGITAGWQVRYTPFR